MHRYVMYSEDIGVVNFTQGGRVYGTRCNPLLRLNSVVTTFASPVDVFVFFKSYLAESGLTVRAVQVEASPDGDFTVASCVAAGLYVGRVTRRGEEARP